MPEVDNIGYRPEQPARPLRIGTRVRATKGDWFVSEGELGLVVNAMSHIGQVRVNWDADKSCLWDVADLEVIPNEALPASA